MPPDWYEEIGKMLDQSQKSLIASRNNLDEYLAECRDKKIEPTQEVIDGLLADFKNTCDAVETLKAAIIRLRQLSSRQ